VRELLQRRPLGVPIRDTATSWLFALLAASVLLDLVAWFGIGVRDTTGTNVGAYAVLLAGVVVAVVATLSGLAETLDLPDDIRSMGLTYCALFTVISLLLIGNLYLRNGSLRDQIVPPLPLFISLSVLVLVGIGAWLSGLITTRQLEEELEEEAEEPIAIARRRRRR